MYSRILVATDGSHHAMNAVRAAADIANKYDAALTICHVHLHGEPPSAFRRMAEVEHMVGDTKMPKIEITSIPGGIVGLATAAEEKRIEAQTIDAVGEYVLRSAETVAKLQGVKNIKTLALDGDMANQILKAAAEADADLVVIGSRGFGPLKSLLVGSVSQKVSQHAECACLIVR